MPIVLHFFARQHGDRIGAEPRVQRLHQPERRDSLGDIDMRPHRQRMDPGVGPPGGVERHPLAEHRKRRLLDRLLHARAVGLALEPHERRAIVLEGEGEAGQRTARPPSRLVSGEAETPRASFGRRARSLDFARDERVWVM